MYNPRFFVGADSPATCNRIISHLAISKTGLRWREALILLAYLPPARSTLRCRLPSQKVSKGARLDSKEAQTETHESRLVLFGAILPRNCDLPPTPLKVIPPMKLFMLVAVAQMMLPMIKSTEPRIETQRRPLDVVSKHSAHGLRTSCDIIAGLQRSPAPATGHTTYK